MTDSDKIKTLPLPFLERMKEMLGDDYDAFLKSYENPRTYGLRVNTAKLSCQEFEALSPFKLQPIPWISNGYFYNEESRPARCPYYQAGLYYLQEPSAMTPASRLPIEPGDFVLDLCAAPGGKATALGAALNDTGFLLANDISTSRARALLRNLELFGIKNMLVTDEKPAKLAQRFPSFFNKILLDAPCSGEGMFRKEEALARDWTPEKSAELSDIQKDLVLKAADMLRPGGMLLYSTCTFAPCEDEEVVAYLLSERPDMELIEMPGYEGFSAGRPKFAGAAAAFDSEELRKCVRIFPHKMDGEGHFLALFRKKGDSLPPVFRSLEKGPDKNTRKWLDEFFAEIGLKTLGGQEFDWNRVEVRKDKVYYHLPFPLDLRGISFLRNGLYLGDLKKNRFEPSQPLALALHKGDIEATISLSVSDERITRYLKGETLNIEPDEAAHKKGWHLLCADGYPVGFGKLVNGILKNKYPAGWRV
ncbi:RsmB/NOP family class I SAM-dependent RNA methyltransferase [Blautia sp. CLA-JM-H16]|uniref:RsmB/NOP family class I SAM-dependent RNA methyltransferase n=1 Tax=Blautia aquisgranensis TaxID=3133153 RepID=A0ABV1BFB8_9FIRM